MMRWIYKLPLRLQSLFRKNRVERELRDELRFHLEKLVEENVAKGMPPKEARYAALRELGGVEQIKEECRDMRRVNFIQDLIQDVHYGLRQLRRNPGFTAVAVLTLALGIGANTAIFSVVNAVMLQPLPFSQADRLVSLGQQGMPKGAIDALQKRSQTMEIGAYSWNEGVNLARQGQSVEINQAQVSGNFFSLLGGLRPELGHIFQPNDEMPGEDHVVILSHVVWQRLFDADSAIVGKWITLDGVPRQVVGVMPPGFRFPSQETSVWVPMEINPRNVGDFWGAFMFAPVGRLRPERNISEARAEFKTLVPQIVKLFPWPMPKGWGEGGDVIPLQQYLVGNVRTKLLILLGAVGLVLLIACSNVANLLLTRSAMRQKEIAVRAAIGAGRARIVRQLFTESLLVATGGGLLGVAMALVGMPVLRNILPFSTPRMIEAGIDARVLLFTGALTLLTGLVFGLTPAIRASRPDLEQTLRAASPTTSTGQRRRSLSEALVIGEAAIAVLLVIGAGLLVKSLWDLSHVHTGFNSKHLLAASINPSPSFCKMPIRCANFYDELLSHLRAMRGVRAAALSDGIPFAAYQTVLAEEGDPSISAAHPYQTWAFQITPGYLRVMGIPLFKGRSFTDADRAGELGVVLVSVSLAQRLWPGQNPIGKRVKPSWEHDWRSVVGVVGDVRADALKPQAWSGGIGAVYFPYRQGIAHPPAKMTLIVRTSGRSSQIAAQLPHLVANVNPDVSVSHIRTMIDVMSSSIADPRSMTTLFIIFAALALILGALGIYGVLSYSVAERTHEIGVRMALGAQKGDVLKMVVRQGMTLALVGVGSGVIGALALTRFLSSLLYGVKATDPVTFAVVSVILVAVALFACYIPARRAAKVDPMVALRHE